MRKQARKLWLGDWQRDDEAPVEAGPDPGDSFVITPEDDGAERQRDVRRTVAGVAVVVALFALGIALSSGADDTQLVSERAQPTPEQTPQTQIPQQVPQAPPPQGFGGGGGFGGPDLTGAEADKAAAAALAQFPGDIERVTRGPGGGGYVVHVIQPEGIEVHVIVDDKFKVQGSDAGQPRRGFGGGTSQ